MLMLVRLSPRVPRWNKNQHLDYIKLKNDLYLLGLSGNTGQFYIRGTLINLKGASLDINRISLDEIEVYKDYSFIFYPSMLSELLSILDTLEVGEIDSVVSITGLFYKNDSHILCRVDSIQSLVVLDSREKVKLAVGGLDKNVYSPWCPVPEEEESQWE